MEDADVRVRLARSGWLTLVPEDFRDTILKTGRVRHYRRGEPVYRIDDPPGGIYGLAEGAIGVEIAPAERAPTIGHFARPGWWFGEGPVLTGCNRLVGVFARTNATLLYVSLNDLRAMTDANPAIWRWLGVLSVMTTRLAISIADDMMIRDSRQRTIALLMRLAGLRDHFPSGAGPSSAGPFLAEVTQTELAQIANLSRSSLTPILRGLEQDGSIVCTYGAIEIRTPQRLHDELLDAPLEEF